MASGDIRIKSNSGTVSTLGAGSSTSTLYTVASGYSARLVTLDIGWSTATGFSIEVNDRTAWSHVSSGSSDTHELQDTPLYMGESATFKIRNNSGSAADINYYTIAAIEQEL